MQTVRFTRMADGTKAEYEFLEQVGAAFNALLPDRILRALDGLKGSVDGYQISRFEHSVQTATRAQRDGRDAEYVVMALAHDIGDGLAPYTHSEMIGAVLRPFVRPEVCWIASHHGVFQYYYYGHHLGLDQNARDAYRQHEWFNACAEFCEKYDQQSFDPAYENLPIQFFEPMVRRVFAEPRYEFHRGAQSLNESPA
jgi:predicted HD phosphohydrolase